MNRCLFESFAGVWIKYPFFCGTTQCSRWQRLKCPIRKKILDRWNVYVLWNLRDPNTSEAVTYPKRTNISCLRILSSNEFYALNLQVLLSEKYFEPIILIDARIFVKSMSVILSQCLWTLTHQSYLPGCGWYYTQIQLLSGPSVLTRRLPKRANSQHCNVKYSTFADLPLKQFYVITVNSFDDDYEITGNCLEIKCKQNICELFCTLRWYILLLQCLNGPCRTLASFRINFQTSLTPVFCRSFLTSHSHLFLDFPIKRFPSAIFLNTSLTILSPGILINQSHNVVSEVKSSLFTPWRRMAEWRYSTILLDGTRWRLVSFTSRSIYFWGKEPLVPLMRRLRGWQTRRERWNQTTVPLSA